MAHWRTLRCAALLMLLAATAASRGFADEPAPAAAAPLPVPDATSAAKAEAAIRDVYRADYAKRDDAGRAALARALLKQADDPANDPATRYVALRDARDAALAGGDVKQALAAMDAMLGAFAVDRREEPVAFLNAAARKLPDPKAQAQLAQAGLAWVDLAAADDDYDAALNKLAPAVEAAAARARDGALAARVHARLREVRAMKDEQARVAAASRALATDPDDPKANVIAGRFLCFAKGDWAKGLPMLVKGADAPLAAVAAQDLAGADAVDKQLALADAWLDLASKHPDDRAGAQVRAQHWYLAAMKDAKGLARTRILKKLTALPSFYDFDGLRAIWDAPDVTKFGDGSDGDHERPAQPAYLVGFEYTLGTVDAHPIIHSIRPLYLAADGPLRGHRPYGIVSGKTPPATVEAKPGYSVGGLMADNTSRLNGFKVRFMRVHGIVLDPDDAYESPWIGGHANGAAPKLATLANNGRPVVGIGFRSGSDVDAIGLVQVGE